MSKKTIWKYELPLSGKAVLKMPDDAEVLSLQVDQKTSLPCLWALCDPMNPHSERWFEVFSTGEPIHFEMGIERKFIGTFQYQKGEYIAHVFER